MESSLSSHAHVAAAGAAPRTDRAALRRNAAFAAGWSAWGIGLATVLGGGGATLAAAALIAAFGFGLTSYGLHPDRDWS